MVDLFDTEEIRIFVHLETGEWGKKLLHELPGCEVTRKKMAYKAVVKLEDWGLFDDEIYDALVRERPGREADIRSVQNFGHDDRRAA